jgi:hypothetical protein
VDDAEEEETKEAVLAYYFLLKSKQGLTEPKLDERVERWFADRHDTTLDFEVDDALAKLEVLKLLKRGEKGLCQVLPLDEALAQLDHIWDNQFQYNVDKEREA